MTNENLKNAELQTLLEGKPLSVLIVGEDKIIFAFNTNIGYIENKKLILKSKYDVNGELHNAVLEEMINVVKQTYQLNIEDSVIVKGAAAIVNSSAMDQLIAIKEMIENESEETNILELLDNAENIAHNNQSESTNLIVQQINLIVGEKIKLNNSGGAKVETPPDHENEMTENETYLHQFIDSVIFIAKDSINKTMVDGEDKKKALNGLLTMKMDTSAMNETELSNYVELLKTGAINMGLPSENEKSPQPMKKQPPLVLSKKLTAKKVAKKTKK